MSTNAPPARSIALAFLLLGALLPSSPGAQETATLAVTVKAADTQRPLAGAQVILDGSRLAGTTDASGRLRIANLAPKAQRIEVRFLGYAGGSATVPLEAGRTANLEFVLDIEPIELAEVSTSGRPTVLQATGFTQRRGGGQGTFITREDIVRQRPRYMSDVLRRVPGFDLREGASGSTARANVRGTATFSGCPIQYYIDGALTSIRNVEDIPPEIVEGIEIYRGASTVPPSFNRGTALCGVVLVWTREGRR